MQDGLADPDEVPEPPVEAITQPGDLWLLGKHRLLCGDSTQREDVLYLMDGMKSDMIFTDPPYNVNYGENQSGPVDEQWSKIANDNMPQDQYEKWLKQVITNAVGVLADGACLYIWNGNRQFGPMYEMLLHLNVHVSAVITWAKESFSLG
jgi:DNA modification methylase